MTVRTYDPSKDALDQLSAMDRAQELFLPVHGHVLLYREEIAIINHPSFQRLRRVRQLGLAHLVFPGATHTRFEHSVGAVHVAQMIVNHVNGNFRKGLQTASNGDWAYQGVNYPTARFIRLGALLHDIGHLPCGHTLEDELHHLDSHDGSQRLSLVASTAFKQYQLDRSLVEDALRPSTGWSLENLVNVVYKGFAQELGLSAEPFVLLTHIVCKEPKSDGAQRDEWKETAELLAGSVDLAVCRDVVGNTICADFLDYLYRDWQHLGKPLYQDKRLYQYMEVRARRGGDTNTEQPKFVINVGAFQKIRHDALTDILELLNARYKLAETVLFHRTKLALTGLLDRCLLEIGELFLHLEIGEVELKRELERMLLDSSDDGLVGVLRKLAGGGTANRQRVQQERKRETEAIEAQIGQTPTLYAEKEETLLKGQLSNLLALLYRLIERLRDREVYSLVHKLRMCDFVGPHNPENPQLKRVLSLYKIPKNRLNFLQGIEARCGLPAGALIMYCPPDARMNAKIARVNLFIEGDVYPFDEYENGQGDLGLTRGALAAQVNRFYELWSAYVFIERTCWDGLTESGRRNLRSLIQTFFYQADRSTDPRVVRSQIDSSVQEVLQETQAAAFRAKFGKSPTVEKFRGFRFPAGLPFDID